MSSCNKPLNLCKDSLYPKEKFWMDDLRELYQNSNYLKFFPKYEMTRAEQLNAITRFCLYFILLIIIFDKNEDWLYIPITIIVLVVILYNINVSDEESKKKEFNKIIEIRKNKRNEEKRLEQFEKRHDGEEEVEIDIDDKHYDDLGREYDLQSGYYDSNGILRVGSKSGFQQLEDIEPFITIDEMIDRQKNTCRRPTNDNPFMNLNITEYNNGDPPVACNADDDEIKDDMTVKFNHELFRDVDELWERANSQRQFYTMPNHGVPNNQIEFAKWLYKIPKTCKEDQSNCLRYEDLRSRRDPVPL